MKTSRLYKMSYLCTPNNVQRKEDSYEPTNRSRSNITGSLMQKCMLYSHQNISYSYHFKDSIHSYTHCRLSIQKCYCILDSLRLHNCYQLRSLGILEHNNSWLHNFCNQTHQCKFGKLMNWSKEHISKGKQCSSPSRKSNWFRRTDKYYYYNWYNELDIEGSYHSDKNNLVDNQSKLDNN